MVYIPPPFLSTPQRPSYAEAYANVLAAHRRSPLTSASSVILLVAPDVDALCAARMLADLFKQDDVMHRLIPVSGIAELERVRDELITLNELHTLFLLNMGSILDLPSSEWFGDFQIKMRIHVIDSTRPQNLPSLFGAGENSERVIIWDDSGAENLVEEQKAWEALTYEPEPQSDEEDSDVDSDRDDELLGEDGDDDDDLYRDSTPSGKRRSSGEGERKAGKRRRTDGGRPHRMTREERDTCAARLEKHYLAGTWYGQSAAGTIYLLATALGRADNELLWLAILGLTYQYTTSRISRESYDTYHTVYYDEVSRLNPPQPANASLHPDDLSVRPTEELRFTLFRHWTLYDAMYHSSYVGGKLGIWREKGKKRLTGLLAKMGFSIPQSQQSYSHMDLDLKSSLVTKLQSIAPEYGLLELSYPSFSRCYGYQSQPLSAADAVEAIGALLYIASTRMEIEVEGSRGGGEWFGAGKVWEGGKTGKDEVRVANDVNEEVADIANRSWWIYNFWKAYDALTNIKFLREALYLSMSLHKAIIRQGTSIIDHHAIRTMRSHRVVVLSQGPDLALFTHPGVLSRLALWLVDTLRDRLPSVAAVGRKKGKKVLPLVLACLKEDAGTYIIVGVMAALEFGGVRKNEFGLAFLDARERCNARTRHGSFDTSVLEINQADLKVFLETLCDGTDGY